MSDDKKKIVAEIPKETNEELEEYLNYGDTKSGFTREAIERKLEKEAKTDD